jgi:hypothetical protein
MISEAETTIAWVGFRKDVFEDVHPNSNDRPTTLSSLTAPLHHKYPIVKNAGGY